MNIRKLEDLSKKELIEIIRHERESHTVDTHEMTPVAHRLIFKLNAGREWPHLWVNGLPTKEILGSIAKDNSARVQYAYSAPVRSNHCEDILHMVPDGWKLVPVEPTYDMTQAGVNLALSARISGAYPWPTYIRDMYKAMLATAPQPDHIPDAGKMIDPVVKESLTVEPTDTEMLNWLIEKEALICHSVTANLYEIWFDIDNVETGKTAREAIEKAMRGEE